MSYTSWQTIHEIWIVQSRRVLHIVEAGYVLQCNTEPDKEVLNQVVNTEIGPVDGGGSGRGGGSGPISVPMTCQLEVILFGHSLHTKLHDTESINIQELMEWAVPHTYIHVYRTYHTTLMHGGSGC